MKNKRKELILSDFKDFYTINNNHYSKTLLISSNGVSGGYMSNLMGGSEC